MRHLMKPQKLLGLIGARVRSLTNRTTRWRWALRSTLIGLAIIGCSFLVDGGSRWAAIMIEVGAGIALVGAIVVLEDVIRGDLSKEIAEQIEPIVERLRTLEGLDASDEIAKNLHTERYEELDELRQRFRQSGRYDDFRQLSTLAVSLNVIKRDQAIHVPIPGKESTFAVACGIGAQTSVHLTRRGTGTGEYWSGKWADGDSIEDFTRRVHDAAVGRHETWPGPGEFDVPGMLGRVADELYSLIDARYRGADVGL